MAARQQRRQRVTPLENTQHEEIMNWLTVTFKYDPGNCETGIPRSSVYDDYLEHLHQPHMSHQQPVNSPTFGKLVKSVFPGIRTRRLGNRGKSRYNYCGITYTRPLRTRTAQTSSSQARQRLRSRSITPPPIVMDQDEPMIQDNPVQDAMESEPQQEHDPPAAQQRLLDQEQERQASPCEIQQQHLPKLQLFAEPSTTDPSKQAVAVQLTAVYYQHCQELLNLMMTQQDIGRCVCGFYSTISEDMGQIVNGDQQVTDAIWRWDCILYDTLIHAVLPSIQALISTAMRDYLRTCLSAMPNYYTTALADYSDSLVNKKMTVMQIFIAKLDRHLGLNQLAQTAHQSLVTQARDMRTDWQKISMDNVLDGAQWMSPWGSDEALGQQLCKVNILLQRQCKEADANGISAWMDWTHDIVHQHMITPHDTISWVKESIQRWTLYSSLILRELSLLQDATTLDAFRALWTFVNDYVIYLAEEAIAARNMAAIRVETKFPRTFSSADSIHSNSLS